MNVVGPAHKRLFGIHAGRPDRRFRAEDRLVLSPKPERGGADGLQAGYLAASVTDFSVLARLSLGGRRAGGRVAADVLPASRVPCHVAICWVQLNFKQEDDRNDERARMSPRFSFNFLLLGICPFTRNGTMERTAGEESSRSLCSSLELPRHQTVKFQSAR